MEPFFLTVWKISKGAGFGYKCFHLFTIKEGLGLHNCLLYTSDALGIFHANYLFKEI